MTIKNLTESTRKDNFQDGDLIEYSYPNGRVVKKRYYAIPEPTEADFIKKERAWRNMELKSTDSIVPLTDHPQHAAYMTYRQELRDYPTQPDFPNGERPVRP